MSEEEGAKCDECGARIGPHGCCQSRRLDAVNAEAYLELREAYEALEFDYANCFGERDMLRNKLIQADDKIAELRKLLEYVADRLSEVPEVSAGGFLAVDEVVNAIDEYNTGLA